MNTRRGDEVRARGGTVTRRRRVRGGEARGKARGAGSHLLSEGSSRNFIVHVDDLVAFERSRVLTRTLSLK